MLKITAGLISGTLALCLTRTVFADPKPASPPERILVTLQIVEVPSGTGPVSVSNAEPASEVYKALLQAPGAQATEISLRTPADFPGTAQYSHSLAFTAQGHGKPSLGVLSAPTSLEATPHVNTDGTITVQINMEVTSFVSPASSTTGGTVPATTSQSMRTTRTFTSGKTVLLGGLLRAAPKSSTSAGDGPKEVLQFVTVTVLPSEKTAQR